MSDYGSHFIDGPWDWEPGEPVPAHTGQTTPVLAVSPAVVPPSKTAYTTVRVLFKAPATPGSTVATGYEMACLLEDELKLRFKEWVNGNMDFEVFVQVDVR